MDDFGCNFYRAASSTWLLACLTGIAIVERPFGGVISNSNFPFVGRFGGLASGTSKLIPLTSQLDNTLSAIVAAFRVINFDDVLDG